MALYRNKKTIRDAITRVLKKDDRIEIPRLAVDKFDSCF